MPANSDGLILQQLIEPEDADRRTLEALRAGLTSSPKTLSPMHFYDERGSALFEEITQLPEYYPTRAETSLLEAHSRGLMRNLQPSELVEIGSGYSRKTRLLIEAMHEFGGDRYLAFDVSDDAIEAAARELGARYEWLEIHGVVGDFHEHLGRIPAGPKRLVAFLGSTFGNLELSERGPFLRDVGSMMKPDDRFLLGVDLVKDLAVMEAAYNDSRGVTAEFNKNVLHVLNRRLDADFPVDDFEHVAFFNEEVSRMEMWLEAQRAMTVQVRVLDLVIEFEQGERMHTEISCKFTRASVEAAFEAGGLRPVDWREENEWGFGLALAARG